MSTTLAERFGRSGHRVPESFAAAFAMGTHARLGEASAHGDMPSELLVQTCAALPCVPRGAVAVPLLAVPRYEETFVQDTRALAPSGLWVSDPFRFYSDPHPRVGNPAFEDMSPGGPTLLWHDTGYSKNLPGKWPK